MHRDRWRRNVSLHDQLRFVLSKHRDHHTADCNSCIIKTCFFYIMVCVWGGDMCMCLYMCQLSENASNSIQFTLKSSSTGIQCEIRPVYVEPFVSFKPVRWLVICLISRNNVLLSESDEPKTLKNICAVQVSWCQKADVDFHLLRVKSETSKLKAHKKWKIISMFMLHVRI